MKESEPGDCSQKVLRHWGLLNVLAKARYRDVNTADEALMYVLDKLEENGWSRVRAHRGEASFRSYLSHVVYRLLTDFDRHRFGRRRMPDWVRAQGSLWEQIYKLLCLERLTANAVVETLRSAVPGGHSTGLVREAIAVIRARIRDCGAVSPHQREVRLSPDDASRVASTQSAAETSFGLSPEALQAATQRARVLESIRAGLLAEPGNDRAAPPEGWLTPLRRLGAELRLTSEERLLLRLVYQEGVQVTEAGRLLGLGPHQVHGRLRRLLARIHEALKAVGLDRELRAVLDAGSRS